METWLNTVLSRINDGTLLPAAYYRELDCDAAGFEWVDFSNSEASIYAFLRHARPDSSGGAPVLVVCNLTPVVRHGYRIGVPHGGRWRELANSDAHVYGGSGQGNGGSVAADEIAIHGRPCSLSLTLPPLGVLFLQPEGGG